MINDKRQQSTKFIIISNPRIQGCLVCGFQFYSPDLRLDYLPCQWIVLQSGLFALWMDYFKVDYLLCEWIVLQIGLFALWITSNRIICPVNGLFQSGLFDLWMDCTSKRIICPVNGLYFKVDYLPSEWIVLQSGLFVLWMDCFKAESKRSPQKGPILSVHINPYKLTTGKIIVLNELQIYKAVHALFKEWI